MGTAVAKIINLLEGDDKHNIKQAKVHQYEKQIDRMVYKLYGLAREEIKIVEGGEK